MSAVAELELMTFWLQEAPCYHQAISTLVILHSAAFAGGAGRIIFDELGGEGLL